MESKKMQVGFNTFDTSVLNDSPVFLRLLECKPDFLWCHCDPEKGLERTSTERVRETAEKIKSLGYDFIANFEFMNFDVNTKYEDGYEWANSDDGTHRLRLPADYVEALVSQGNLIGMGYDEFEHVIINRNISIALATKWKVNLPAFKQLDTKDPVIQGEALEKDLKAYVNGIKEHGVKSFSGEHVFPVLFHTFARCGIIPNFKSQKEIVSNIHFAIAAGAALEYGTPLYNCVDMWHKLTYPGHSAQEMYNNLVFAYYSGVNRVYVEAESALVDKETGNLNENGEAYSKFCSEFIGKDRDYDVSDYRPEIGIIRYDDTYWGQNLIWARGLFGNKKIKPGKESREWLGILNTITFGESYIHGPTWNRIDIHSLTPHRSFISMNSLAVFDDVVRRDTLSSLKLCFLCGIRISSETVADVASLVRENGLVAVVPPRFLPEELKKQVKGSYTEIKDGKGSWIVTGSFTSSKLRKRISGFLGNRGEIRLTYSGGKEIRMKIDGEGNTLSII